MSDIEHGTRVELLPGKEGVYQQAVAGAQGFVTDTRDDEGFRMVYVEWDQDHPRYTGEPDCWTFESHFKILRAKHDLFDVIESPDAFLDEVFERAQAEGDADAEVVEGYINRLSNALNILADCDGFILIATKMETDPEDPERRLLIPHVYSASLSERTMALIEAQIVQLAAIAHQEMSISILNQYQMEEDELTNEDEDDEE